MHLAITNNIRWQLILRNCNTCFIIFKINLQWRGGMIWNVDTDIFLFKMQLRVNYWKVKAFCLKTIFLKNIANPGILWRMSFRTNCTHSIFMNLNASFPLTFGSALVSLSTIERKKEKIFCHFPSCLEVSPTFICLLQENALPGKVAGK